MYRKLLFAFILSLIFSLSNLTSVIATDSGVIILCYHDVVDKPYNAFTITPATLKENFEYLKKNGYHPISLEQYTSYCKNGTPLPDKSVLLTFDDGYESFYTTIFPLLKEYNYSAVFAIVTSWTQYSPPDVGKVLKWQQIREMEKTGLISIASHSHQSHRYTTTNPQGDSGSTLENRRYVNGKYESIDVYRQRIQRDFKQAQAVFEKELGHKVKAMVWPYGDYTQFAVDLGREEGFEFFFGLNGGFNPPNELSLSDARRGIIENTLVGEKFSQFIKAGARNTQNINATQLNLDQIYNPVNPSETEHNIDLAIERFSAAQINTVFLQAVSDPNGTGNIESVYFYTKEAPVKADILSHVTTKFINKGFHVYASMPTLACQWLLKDQTENEVIAYADKGKGRYNRATPFSPVVQKRLEALFSDLAAYSPIDGILFQDDLSLNEYEDFSPAAKTAFYNATGYELTPDILQDNKIRAQWTQMKTNSLTELTQKLTTVMRQYRPYLDTARNIAPSVINQPDSEERLAENYSQYLSTYNYTIISAYPYMEKQSDKPLSWLDQLAGAVLKNKDSAQKTIFKLQTYDWNKKQWLSTKELSQQIAILKSKKAIHFAYYPENIFSE